MIGQHSTTELGAAAFVNNMFVLVLVFGLGFAYGLTPIVGSLYAREENNKIGGMLKNALLVNTLLAVLLVAAMFLLYLNLDNWVTRRITSFNASLLHCKSYIVTFLCWFNTFKQLFDGTTDTKIPMWIMLGGNVFNIVGNYVLIYGKLGFPETWFIRSRNFYHDFAHSNGNCNYNYILLHLKDTRYITMAFKTVH